MSAEKENPNLSGVAPIKQFFLTYKAAVGLAWSVDKKMLTAITLMNSLNGLLVLPSLFITKALVDTVLKGIITNDLDGTIKYVAFYLFLEFIIYSAKGAFERFDWVFGDNLSRRVSVSIQIRSLEKINKLAVQDAENPKVRNLFKKVFDQSGRRAWGMIMPISYLPFLVFSLISTAIPIISYKLVLILPVLLFALPEIFVGAKFSKKEYELSTKQSPIWRMWAAYDDLISRGRYIYENKILGHTKELIGRISKLADQSFSEIFNIRFGFGKRRFLVSLPIGVVNLGLKIWFYGQAIVGKITLGTAQMQLQAITQFAGSLTSLGRQVNEIYENYLYVSDYKEFIGYPEENIISGTGLKTPFEKGIVFDNVWFKYPSSVDWVLKGVSFSLDSKENLAIVGKNGAGKTTIIKLLCKYYLPQKGKILVNGTDIQKYSSKAYRMAIAALFQDFAQYPFSAKENIGFGDVGKLGDISDIKKVAKMVGIDEFIESLPQKYANPLDIEFDGGIEPSKGQWQRLALARALYRNAEIFVLDEPTSNVDPQAEEEIFDKIISLEKDKIVLLTSHRFSTVRKADKILVLNNGKVLEYGTHLDLIKTDGEYAYMFKLQAKSYQ